MSNILITSGFVWNVLDEQEAKEAFQTNELFILRDDESESLIDSYHQFDSAINNGLKVGMEIGQESELISDWQEATERSNETRSFMAWLEDKAENLLS